MSRRTESEYLPDLTAPDVVPKVTTPAFPSRRTVLPGIALVFVLVVWEFGLPVVGVESYILPTPSAIAGAFVANHEVILSQLWVTISEFLAGFTATVVSGYLLALAMTYSRTLEATVYPYVVVVRSIPVVTLLPIFIIWFGFGMSSIVVISFLISFFPMVVNSLSGFKSADEDLVEMLESFSATRREVFWNVYRYASLPSVFAGLKICTILAFTGAIVGEFLIGQAGIGYLILEYNSSLATPEMFASIFVVSATELLIFGTIHRVESVVVDWR
ncbi:ABC transporter permease [Haloferax sp. YSMS24]|uniref:ABC transporter permease n=1 Tax=Haloferax sp. YSMS24 TaxID=3388425 RepID=UPI00398C8CFC